MIMQKGHFKRLDEIIHQMVAASYVLKHKSVPDGMDAMAESLQITRKVAEVFSRVQGNRSGNNCITWDDAKLYFLSAMELARTTLEDNDEQE